MDSSLLKKVWFIEMAPLADDGHTTSVRKGGGLCIDPNGLILTVAHIVTVGDLKPEACKIRARAYGDEDLNHRVITLIDVLPHFDLALIKASKSENEVFDFVPIRESIQAVIGEHVYGYVHQNNLLFSGVSGATCYPLPKNIILPDITKKTTMKSSGFLKSNPTFDKDQPYRTVASVTEISDVAFHDLHPRLPLVQISGFGTAAGASGCPVFKCGSGELIGIFTIQKLSYHFVIPVNFLKIYVDHVREVKKELIDC